MNNPIKELKLREVLSRVKSVSVLYILVLAMIVAAFATIIFYYHTINAKNAKAQQTVFDTNDSRFSTIESRIDSLYKNEGGLKDGISKIADDQKSLITEYCKFTKNQSTTTKVKPITTSICN